MAGGGGDGNVAKVSVAVCDVCHVCDDALLRCLSRLGGGRTGSKFSILTLQHSFQFVFHKIRLPANCLACYFIVYTMVTHLMVILVERIVMGRHLISQQTSD